MVRKVSNVSEEMGQGRTLGVGIIGLGWVAGEHIKAYQQNPHCRVVALASRSPERSEELRQLYGLPDARAYTDYQDLLKDEAVDVVSICSMNHEHGPQAIAAAEAGKHLLIEKPMALTLEELRRVQRAIERAGVKSQGGFELNWGGYFQSIQNMIDAGFFGDLYYAECDYFSGNWEKWYPGYSWVKTREKGGSALPAAGAHAVDALRQFMRSDATEVFAYAGNFTSVMEWDPTILTVVRFANGGIGKVGCVLEGNVKYQFNVRLHGAKGTLVNDTFRTTYMDPGLEGYARFPTILPDTPEVTHHPFPGEIDDLIDAIRHDRQPRLNPAEDAKTYEIVFGAEQSAREGRPVKLPLP
jgi:predicted dehydrogenase